MIKNILLLFGFTTEKSRIHHKMGKKRKFEIERKEETEFNLPARFLATSHIRAHEKRLIVVLEGAQLETVKVKRINYTY